MYLYTYVSSYIDMMWNAKDIKPFQKHYKFIKCQNSRCTHTLYRKSNIRKQISIDLSKYICTIYACVLSICRFQRCKMYTNTLDKHRIHNF